MPLAKRKAVHRRQESRRAREARESAEAAAREGIMPRCMFVGSYHSLKGCVFSARRVCSGVPSELK